jgi:AraC-like DNA-binding protein
MREQMITFSSLQAQHASAKTCQEKLYLCWSLADMLVFRNQPLAQQYITEGLAIAERLNAPTQKAFLLNAQMLLFRTSGQTQKQYETLFYLILTLESIEDTIYYNFFISLILISTPTIFQKISTTETTLYFLFKSLEGFNQKKADAYISSQTNFKAFVNQNISFLYLQMQEYEKSFYYLQLADLLVHTAAHSSYKDKYLLYNAWVSYYWKTSNWFLCIECAKKNIDFIQKELGADSDFMDARFLQLYIILGNVYLNGLKKYDQALEYFKKAIDISLHFGLYFNTANAYAKLSTLENIRGNLQAAFEYSQQSIAMYQKYVISQSENQMALLQRLLHVYAHKNKIYTFLDTFLKQSQQTEVQKNAYNRYAEGLEFYHYIVENYHKTDLSVEDIAKHFNMCSRTLNRRIQLIFALNTQKLITFIRLQKAYELLTCNQHSITEIAEKVGFEHLSYFAKIFKLQFGCLPSQIKSRF